jgi:DNA-binding NtrC family response regulator
LIEELNMELKGKALLVCQNEGVFGELRQVLETLGLEAVRVRGCKELQPRLQDLGVLAVFTEANLTDGRYSDVCRIASQPPTPLPVIVVSPFVDVDLYLDSMESGASDFIVPPFFTTDVAYVLMTALTDGLPQRVGTPRHAAGTA